MGTMGRCDGTRRTDAVDGAEAKEWRDLPGLLLPYGEAG